MTTQSNKKSRFSFKQRIIAGFTIPILLIVISTGINYSFVSNINKEIQGDVQNELPDAQSLQRLATNS